MKMSNNCAFILLMVILTCNSVHTFPHVGKAKPRNGFKEYAAKPKGTIKTMKWHGRDLVDCVDVYKQPSMNHPLLKNHSIQFHDTFPANSLIKRNVSHSNLIINVPENERCPNGTIPIRRPFKDELTRAAFPRSRHGNHSNVNPSNDLHKYAVVAKDSNGGKLFIGVSGGFNVWKPTTEINTDTFSLAQLWAAYIGPGESFTREVVEAGWMVYPRLFGDREPRFFIYFTNNAYATGCWNLGCGNFVHVSPEVCIGCVIPYQSTYEGDQYEIEFGIAQNPSDKAWWIKYNNVLVGYYPNEFLPKLREGGATEVDWGGEVTQWPDERASSNQMGSGHFPEEGFRKAAFIGDLQYEEADLRVYTPVDANVRKIVTHPHCYGISQLFGEGEGEIPEAYFYYGGPGASAPGCDA